MIFITVGSRSFQFERLLKAVDLAIEKGEISDEVFAQVGSSTYQVKNYKTVDFLNHEEFNKKLNECDVVLTHGGTGVIVNAIKLGTTSRWPRMSTREGRALRSAVPTAPP